MEKNKKIPILDYNELVEYIKQNTNYEKNVIEKVLDLETDYMKELGIVTVAESYE